jgi:carbonic anhydrase
MIEFVEWLMGDKNMNTEKREASLRDRHHCEAILVSCVDFRVWEAFVTFVKERMDVHDFDLSSQPGGVKNLIEHGEALLEDKKCVIEGGLGGVFVSCRLHGMKTVVLTAHEDCGAYGGAKAFASRELERAHHLAQLRRARFVIEEVLKSGKGNCLNEDGSYTKKNFVLLWGYFSDDGEELLVTDVTEEVDAME